LCSERFYPELSTAVSAIRLISFAAEPSTGEGSLLEYTLESYELSSLPPFTALSYTWGSPFPAEGSDERYSVGSEAGSEAGSEETSEETNSTENWDEPIHLAICNQQPVYLRKNLYEALQTMKLRDDRPAYLWVDAICINQSDGDERSSQVGLMSDIYSQADLIIAWLGPEDESSRRAHDLLYTFGTGIEEMILRDGWKKVFTCKSVSFWGTKPFRFRPVS